MYPSIILFFCPTFSKYELVAVKLIYIYIIVLVMFATVSTLLTAHAVASSKPNLLFMMSDQQRHDTLGVVHPSFSTPNLG